MSPRITLLGHPVAHSFSERMMRAAFDELSLDASYTPLDVAPSGLAEAVARLRDPGSLGANVTAPHKVSVCALLDELDPAARAIGAVNTIARRGGSLIGYNTDAYGLTQSLREASVSLSGARVVVLGAGGAARAAVVGCALAGAAEITVIARDLSRAKVLAALAHVAPKTLARGLSLGSSLTREALGSARVIVQATPCGMLGGPPSLCLLAHLDLSVCAPRTVALDLVYNPRETDFLRVSEGLGMLCLDGLEALVQQGAQALALWFGREAPIERMRRALSG